MARLRHGPSDGLTTHETRPVIWAAWRPDCHGKPKALTTDTGEAVTLPDTPGPDTDHTLNLAGGRWECYRRAGADAPEVAPVETDETTTDDPPYIWVRRNHQ